MKQFKPKPQNVKIFAEVVEGQNLMDKRKGRSRLVLGVIPNIARQYGVEAKQENGGFVFIGPVKRIQLLVEKLHFAGVNYFEL